MDNIMNINEFTCGINMPPALKSRESKSSEIANPLPPYAPINVYDVDKYDKCPSNWMHGSINAKSYFTPVKKDHGLWLDFNGNSLLDHDVAIVVSIQGVNPLTGMQTTKLELEQYDKCPRHDVEFNSERYCPQCKYKWPKQNYLSSASCPHGHLWIDGFRTPNGDVRQYVFTDDTSKGVAAQLIGDERVYAIGIAFFKSKTEKPKPTWSYGGWHNHYDKSISHQKWNNNHNVTSYTSSEVMCFNSSILRGTSKVSLQDFGGPSETEQLEIKAGAKIIQQIHDDSNDLDYWLAKPSGIIYINYCTVDDCNKILDGGIREEDNEGFLAGLSTGH